MPKNIYTFHYTYIITNTTNQMKYIGVRSCSCLPENDDEYMGSSKILGETLQETPESFTKTIIDTFPTREIANTNEQWLHETYDVARNSMFYNLCIAPMGFNMCGRTHSKEARKKISEANKGKSYSEETRKKISLSKKGKSYSEEFRKKISEVTKGEKNPFYGKKHSDEAKKKMSESMRGKKRPPRTEEHKKKLIENHVGMKGKKHSAETRAKMSKSQQGKRKPHKRITCPNCNKTGGDNNMKRWHFDNCREIV